MNTSSDSVNDGKINNLVIFAMVFAFLVLFRVVFAAGHILKFKKRIALGELKIGKINLEDEYENLAMKHEKKKNINRS